MGTCQILSQEFPLWEAISMRASAPVINPNRQSHCTPTTVEGLSTNSHSKPLSVSSGLLNLAKVASYPSPPMSGSPSPRQRNVDRDEEQPALLSSGPPSETHHDHAQISDTRKLLDPPSRMLLQQAATRYLLPPPQPQQQWLHTSAPQSLPRLIAQETQHFDSPARSGALVESFLTTSRPVAPQERPLNPQATHSPPQPRPMRKTKAHVASACINCKKAHLSCDVGRPCSRCIASGKQDTCHDVPHKKRGRPKLKSDSSLISESSVTALQPSRDVVRPGRYSFGESSLMGSERQRNLGDYISPRASHPPTDQQLPAGLIAYMDEDLRIVRMNHPFLEAFGVDSRDRDLRDLVHEVCHPVLNEIRSDIMEERITRDPAYLPPMMAAGESDVIPRVDDVDIERATSGYKERTVTLYFRRVVGLASEQLVRLRLARTNVFFIVLELISNTGPSASLNPERQRGPRTLQPFRPQPTEPSLRPSSGYPANSYSSYAQGGSLYASAPQSPFYSLASLSSSLPGTTPTVLGPTVSVTQTPPFEGAFSPAPQESPFGYTQGPSTYLPPTQQHHYRSESYRPPSPQLPAPRTEAQAPTYFIAAEPSQRPRTRQREQTPPAEMDEEGEEGQQGHRSKRRRTDMDIRKVLDD